jgi:hypothetical protein
VVVPSLWPEAYVLVAREALALGVPVLASRLGALPDLVVDGENGYTFDPRARGELSALLRRLDDDRLLAGLREGARGTAVVSMRQHAGAIRAVYLDAVRSRARSEPAGPGPGPLFERLLALGYAGPSHARGARGSAGSSRRYAEAS